MSEYLTQAQAAEIAGITARRLRQLEQEDNGPERNSEGYPARAFGEWLVSRNTGSKLDYTAERARLAKEQADKTELENSINRGTVAEVVPVAERWASVGTNIKTRMLAIPTKLAPLVAGMSDLSEIREVIEKLIHEALTELAGSPPGLPAGAGTTETPQTTTEADSKSVGGRGKKAKPGK